MSRAKRSRIYWREQGGVRRAYGDFRDYADVGGRQEALVATSEKRATADPDTAQTLVARRIEELDGLRRGRALHGVADTMGLAAIARAHLIAKAKEGGVTTLWLEATERCLTRAIAFFGEARPLSSVDVPAVEAFIAHLRTLPATEAERAARARAERGEQPRATRRRLVMSGGTIRHHLNCLSNLFRRAQAKQLVLPGYNPIAALMEKPAARRLEARWLEVHDAALLLEGARLFSPKRDDIALPFAHALVATFLLTGGRRSEVLGLEVDDVSLDRGTVTFRPNAWRRLKTATSHRSVPLWPQLLEILRAYFPVREQMGPGTLLFPSFRTGQEAMLTDERKLLAGVAERAGWKAGEITPKMFRHTYCAARLQSLDQGESVSAYTVGKELGHGGDSLVRRVYGHLGQVRHRAEVVEYRVEQHAAKLGERLTALLSQ
jgi:integrase